jgi:UDP-2-acetamido-2,6-beta-L-arabino-hexul-4-ose reductase
MKVLVTGAKGFIGKNLCLILKERGHEVFQYDVGNTDDELKEYIHSADFVVHLAGINRPLNPQEFVDGNVNFTKKLLDLVKDAGSKAPIIFSSSTQAEKDNDYGKSKKAAEDEIFQFAKDNGNLVYVYRLYNVFGKWCRPNYNSVVATFCYNIANDLPIEINKEAPAIDFVYIDDIVKEFVSVIEKKPSASSSVLHVEPHYSERLDDIANALKSFKESRSNLLIPELKDGFFKKLYSTYLSYLPEDKFEYQLLTHSDQRGSFTEAFKTTDYGQVSVNVSHPGITKGNHYHMSKNEKYLVVSGTCVIKLRKVGEDKIITYTCDGKDLKVVDIPPGYTHNITNIGTEDSVTIMWANELYDPNNPDTYFLPVEPEAVAPKKEKKHQ